MRSPWLVLSLVVLVACDANRAPTACTAASQCTEGTVCIDGACTAGMPCASTRSCPGLVCSTALGVCVECNDAIDCGGSDQCVSGVCASVPDACASDRDCSSIGLVCDTARMRCVECVSAADCPSGACVAGTCMDIDAAIVDDAAVVPDVGTDAGMDAPVDAAVVPTIAWAHDIDGLAAQPQHVASNASGHVALVGTFVGSVDFGSGAMTTAGGNGSFVASYDETGALLWAHVFDARNANRGDVAIDDAGAVTIVGNLVGSVDFGGGPLTQTSMVDSFVAHFDATGAHLWSHAWGGSSTTESVTLSAVAADASGNTTLVGFKHGTAVVGGSTLPPIGQEELLVIALAPNGNVRWVQSPGTTSWVEGQVIAADATRVYVAGQFDSSHSVTLDLGDGHPLASGATQSMFLAAFDGAGRCQWSRIPGALNGPAIRVTPHRMSAHAGVLAIDAEFGRAAAGATVDLGGNAGVLSSRGSEDAFAWLVDGTNGSSSGARLIGGAGSDAALGGGYAGEEIVVSGTFGADGLGVDFGGGPVGGAGEFVGVYGADLSYHWAWTSYAALLAADVAGLPSGRVIVVAGLGGPVDLGGAMVGVMGHRGSAIFALEAR